MTGSNDQEAIARIGRAVLEGDDESAAELTQHAVTNGVAASAILEDALISSMDIVGREYEEGARFVPEMLISAEAMKAAMAVLEPFLASEGSEPRGIIAIGTVEGDLHDIGKNLVAVMFEGAGFRVIDLGVEVTADVYCEAVRKHRPDILALSALLTTTMIHIPDVLKALTIGGLRDQVKVLIGGAPITQAYADEVGADGYAPDAASAVKVAVRLAEKP